jgi:hypothetical protein
MKFEETHFEEYIQTSKQSDLHPKIKPVFQNFTKDITNLSNIIFYGPSGTGKYTLMLRMLEQYSPSGLKYEKKMNIIFNKQSYFFKISDIHYEVDMSLLGCNSKLLWHDVYQQIVDSVSIKPNKTGIIVCKYFHDIHSELLDIFYSYMQNNVNHINIKFVLITEQLSFIPDNILNACEILNVSRPTKTSYNKCLKTTNLKPENINNIKPIHLGIYDLMKPEKIICDKILNQIHDINALKFLKFRDILYDIFIYNLDMGECLYYILTSLIKNRKIPANQFSVLLIKTFVFLQYFNNNYRPIYHLENYLYYITSIINDYNI